MLTEVPGQLPSLPGTEVVEDDENVYSGYADYFGFDESFNFMMPDGKQFISFKAMNEGDRAKYEAKTSRDVKFNRRTDDAAISMNAAADRHELIQTSVTGWNFVRRNARGKIEPVPFSNSGPGGTFNQWLSKANPKIVSDLANAIRKANPWMTDEMDVEQVDEEMKRLQELRQELVERDAAKKSS
jgi:glucan phosphorylase